MKLPSFTSLPPNTQKMCAAGIGLALILAAAVLMLRPAGDRAQDIGDGQTNLRQLRRALLRFQSEEYFSRPPRNLEELWSAGAMAAEVPDPAGKNGEKISVAVTPLIEKAEIFRCPGREDDQQAGFVCDYLLIPYYRPFMPDKTIIMLDKPGNYFSGGNVLYAGGKTEFLKMNPAEYRRFAAAVTERSDRDFVRQKCADCSIAGYKK